MKFIFECDKLKNKTKTNTDKQTHTHTLKHRNQDTYSKNIPSSQ